MGTGTAPKLAKPSDWSTMAWQWEQQTERRLLARLMARGVLMLMLMMVWLAGDVVAVEIAKGVGLDVKAASSSTKIVDQAEHDAG